MPAMSLKQVIETLKERLPRDIGKAALDKARKTCPVQTGELYKSLYLKIGDDGFELGATVSYASDVEEGTQPVMVTGSYTGKWNRFKRTSKNGVQHTVSSHTKTFKGKKPVELSGSSNPGSQKWRTLPASAGKEGTFFIKKAIEDSMKEELEKILESMGATKRKPAKKKG